MVVLRSMLSLAVATLTTILCQGRRPVAGLLVTGTISWFKEVLAHLYSILMMSRRLLLQIPTVLQVQIQLYWEPILIEVRQV